MSSHALAGVRVLDLTRLLPGGLCTLVLADLGADVVKIEAPGVGDYARARGPHLEDDEPSTSSASFRALNRNKQSAVLDLKSADGREAMLRLVAEADVLVESFRPGVLDRLGLGFDVLAKTNPGLVLCQISGWGQVGPKKHSAGHDVNYLAAMGLLSHTGGLDDPPHLPPMQVADASAGLFGACSILAALHERGESGLGQRIDVSIAHSALMLAPMTVAGVLATKSAQPVARGVWSGGVTCYQIYRCADGWVALGALEDKFWRTWCTGVDRPDLFDMGSAPPGSTSHHEVKTIMASRTREEWRRFSEEYDCCLTVVDGLPEALDSPLIAERNSVVRLAHPSSVGDYDALALPVDMSRTPPDHAQRPAPPLGAHTDDVARPSSCATRADATRG